MDFNTKKQIVEKITDEVKILHPLLNHLLRQMEQVNSVEYTHGPNEFGADFIVCRADPALCTHHYIGVVAKTGRILQNFDDVARQVDECLIPRLVRAGLEEVRLTEVWVITTGNISNNAQRKIQDKYKTQKIAFIPGEKLTELIDKYANYFWFDIPSNIGSYFKKIEGEINQLESSTSVLKGLGCDEFYITPDIEEGFRATYKKGHKTQKRRIIDIHKEVSRNSVSLVEGEMGFGKSKLARALVLYFGNPEVYNQYKLIPIYVHFRNLVENKPTIDKIIHDNTNTYINNSDLKDLKILIIVDGLDEGIADENGWRDYTESLIQSIKANPNYHALFTSRPLRALDDIFGAKSDTPRFLLRPLSFPKLIGFIEKACVNASISKNLYEDLQRSDLFKQLPHSPIAAALLSRLISQNSNDLPSNLTELYAKSIESLLGRWDIEKGSCTEKEFKDSERVSLKIADFLFSNHLSSMSLKEAEDMIEEWHAERNTNVPLEKLKERVFYKSGLFAIDKDNGLLTFSHRSFGEFMFALDCIRKNKAIPANLAFEPYYIYPQFFYTGLLGDCEDHLLSLIATNPQNELQQWTKILTMPDYFLAGYQTKYSVVEENLWTIFILASKLYHDIKIGNSKLRIGELPEMHLLWFFQRLIRHCFDYEYFKKSITTTLLKIDSSLEEKSIKEVALFFAACYAAEHDDPSGFEYLVKNYKTEKLQLPISIGIQLEQESNKDFSKLPILKYHEKKLRHLLNATPYNNASKKREYLNAVDELYTKPLNSGKSKQVNPE